MCIKKVTLPYIHSMNDSFMYIYIYIWWWILVFLSLLINRTNKFLVNLYTNEIERKTTQTLKWLIHRSSKDVYVEVLLKIELVNIYITNKMRKWLLVVIVLGTIEEKKNEEDKRTIGALWTRPVCYTFDR